MESDSSRSLKLNNNDNINNVSIDAKKPISIDSTAKKMETSDTDYYLGLLANKTKLNDDSDNNSDYSSEVSEIINDDSDDICNTNASTIRIMKNGFSKILEGYTPIPSV